MSADILSRIIETKKEEVAAAKRKVPEADIRKAARTQRPRRPFFQRLKSPGPSGVNIIAEVKRASPSKGLIRPDLDPAACARQYEAGGAAALSVLTDAQYFKGSFEDFNAARSAVELPALRKDFIISEYQIYESAVLGADAILLIARVLSRSQLDDYLRLAAELNLDVLTEVHSEDDIDAAVAAKAPLVGINNRNLKSFETSLDTSIAMASRLAPWQVPVAESGIRTRTDIEKLMEADIFNFLIGETLVRADDPQAMLKSLAGNS